MIKLTCFCGWCWIMFIWKPDVQFQAYKMTWTNVGQSKNERDSVDLHAMTCTETKMCKWNDGKKIDGYIV